MALTRHEERIMMKRSRIKFFLDDPASRFERRDQACQYLLRLRNER